MVWTEATSFYYFLGGILPAIAAISRGGSYWTCVGIVWAIMIFGFVWSGTRK